MKNYKVWTVIAATTMGMVLASCGSSSSNSVSLRLANATLTHPSLDMLVNSAAAIAGTATDTVSAYVSPGSGSDTLQINDSGSGTVLATTVPTLTSGSHYTVVAYEAGGAVKTVVLGEDFTTPVAGSAELRVYEVAPSAGKLDVYITDPSTDLSTVSSPTYSFLTGVTTPLLTLSPGTYRVRITGYGNKSDLRMDVPSVTLTNQEVVTVLATPAAGGVLLNGSTIVEQGAYSANRNTNTRVRLAAAVPGSPTVTALAGTTQIDSSVAPNLGYYALVPSASALNISVNGQSVGAPAGALPVGGDVTLMVYGSPAVASLITDDNTLPTDPTTVKLSAINGVTGAVGTINVTANIAPIGVNLAPGAGSSAVSIPSSTLATNFVVKSSLHGTLLTNNANVLSANTVYTVFIGGDYTAPVFSVQ